jgi:uncharacterized protein (DUF433 family)
LADLSCGSTIVSFVETRYEHIVLDERGVPRIAGTTMKVVELVTAQLAYGWSPEELHFQFPHLTLGQVHSALAYYWDHREALDADIARRLAAAERLARQDAAASLRARLRARDPR